MIPNFQFQNLCHVIIHAGKTCNPVIHAGNYTRLFVTKCMSQKSVYIQVTDRCVSNAKKKRTEFGQLLQVLEHLYSSNNIIISSIARYTNMSHEAATRNCEKLVKAGLVVREITNNNKKYRLTSDGISFLNYCRNFGDILCRYNLDHILYH